MTIIDNHYQQTTIMMYSWPIEKRQSKKNKLIVVVVGVYICILKLWFACAVKDIEEVPSQLVSGETVGEKKLLGKTSQIAKFAFRFSDISLKNTLNTPTQNSTNFSSWQKLVQPHTG